ncbi:nuclear body protein SP140-like protein isoform X2 [Scophthalmus maximus]|uniref:nuclear body protein SP140-like protein isoform X2 n=1 Tax=Scophthalmus maximus TaxID=52904 RepID=UPI001FA8706F|nr:nuclear body protein SP140-like protein isoform X2 [Scophthalmus maximus]
MDPMDFLESKELLQFFHCHKTEMSCMENPHTFLRQLRDHNLIPEDRYEKVSRMKSKENLKKGLYGVLDWLERERSQHIHLFWRCALKETMMSLYPALRLLRNRLMDGSFQFDTQLPEKVEKDKEKEKSKRKEPSVDEEEEEEQVSSVKKKRKQRRSVCDNEEEQQPGPSSQLTQGRRKKAGKILFYSPLKKGEKSDLWNWPIYRFQLPVTCGSQEGTLCREKLAKGEKCILSQKQWFTPSEFERFAGKQSSKNWKLSIQCQGTPVGKLIKEGHLKLASYKGRHERKPRQAKRSLFPSGHDPTVSEGDEEDGGGDDDDDDDDEDVENQGDQVSSSDKENTTDEESGEQSEQEPEANQVFKVTCGNIAGTLHKKRFGSGTCGKCIRTETSWLNPVEFMIMASVQTDATWRNDIMCEGRPLSALIEANVLRIHSLLCKCRLCKPDITDLEDDKNDDECCVCKEGVAVLVECENCPRSFHQKCHLPHVDDAILGDDRPWLCTFCVTNQEWRCCVALEMEAALSRHISGHMLECHYLLLCLYSADEKQIFALNPSLYLENYSTAVETPMWLGNVAGKLQKKEYQTVGDFVSDVQLIFSNCASYNRANPELLAMGDRLNKLFNKEFKKVFNISEQSAD